MRRVAVLDDDHFPRLENPCATDTRKLRRHDETRRGRARGRVGVPRRWTAGRPDVAACCGLCILRMQGVCP